MWRGDEKKTDKKNSNVKRKQTQFIPNKGFWSVTKIKINRELTKNEIKQ